MTKQECAIVSAYTGITMLTGNDTVIYYEYIEKIMGRPVFTHEIPRLQKEIKRRAAYDFKRLCQEATAR